MWVGYDYKQKYNGTLGIPLLFLALSIGAVG